MSDLFSVCVESRDMLSARLRLQIVHRDEVTFPLSPSFVMMLVDDESLDTHRDFRRWESARADADEDWSSGEHLVSIRLLEVRGLPRAQREPPAGLGWDEVDASEDGGLLGEALYEITVDVEGMLAHLTPGMRWRSTAYDEAGRGPIYTGQAGEVQAWSRT